MRVRSSVEKTDRVRNKHIVSRMATKQIIALYGYPEDINKYVYRLIWCL